MHFKYHILLSLFFLPLFFINRLFLVSLISSILIDLDHYRYLKYIIKNKTINTKKFYNKYKNKTTYFRILHSPYFLVFLLFAQTLTKNLYILNIEISHIIFFVMIGFIYHIVFDIIDIFIIKKRQNSKSIFLKKFAGFEIKNTN